MTTASHYNTNHTNQYNAFTLIELLVVISVIVVLMSLVMGVVNANSADILATTAKIQQVSGAINSYKMTNGSYPLMSYTPTPPLTFNGMDNTTDNITPSDAKTEYIAEINQELRKRLVSVSPEYDIGGEMVGDYSDESSASGSWICILDSWDNPLVYKPYTKYLGLNPGYNIPKKNSFQIWSAGPDGQYDQNSVSDSNNDGNLDSYDPEDSGFVFCDDITNWSQTN